MDVKPGPAPGAIVLQRPTRDLLLLLGLEVAVFVTLARVPFDGSPAAVAVVVCCVILWVAPVVCVFLPKVALTADTLFIDGVLHGWSIPWAAVESVRRDRDVVVRLLDGREVAVSVTCGASTLAGVVERGIRSRLESDPAAGIDGGIGHRWTLLGTRALYFAYLPVISVLSLRLVAG